MLRVTVTNPFLMSLGTYYDSPTRDGKQGEFSDILVSVLWYMWRLRQVTASAECNRKESDLVQQRCRYTFITYLNAV